MKKKRPYLLLEVLIAMALIALAAIPLLAPGIWMLKNEQTFSREIKADREASLLFAEIVKSFYLGQGGRVELPPHFDYSISDAIEKGDANKQYILYEIEITYSPKPEKKLVFPYKLFVERKGGKRDS